MTFIKIPGKDFEMMDAPVTQSEWQEKMGNNPSHFKDQPECPVESVSWNYCQSFIQKLNSDQKEFIYRLPTEDEWKYCAKPCDEQDIMKIAWCWENSDKQTHTVKSREPNKYGLYDMLGNVWEWCQDEIYGSDRVVRGGGWYDLARNLRSGYRDNNSPAERDNDLGFRLVRTPVSLSTITILPLANGKISQAFEKVQEALDELKELLK